MEITYIYNIFIFYYVYYLLYVNTLLSFIYYYVNIAVLFSII